MGGKHRGIDLHLCAARRCVILFALVLCGLCAVLSGVEIPAFIVTVTTPRFAVYPRSLGSAPEDRMDVAEIRDIGRILDPPLIDGDVTYNVIKSDDRMDSGRIFRRRDDDPRGVL